MPLHRKRRTTLPRGKIGPPLRGRSAKHAGVRREACTGQPARAAHHSYPTCFAERSRCANVVELGSAWRFFNCLICHASDHESHS
jgi:hypothetical protein